MDHAHRANAARNIVSQGALDRRWIGAAPPIRFEDDRLKAQPDRHFAPDVGEPAGAHHQDGVARRERVDKRSLPRACPGRRKDDDWTLCAEDVLQPGQHRSAEIGEGRATMVDRGFRNRAKHASGRIGRAGDLQKMPARGASVHGHAYRDEALRAAQKRS